MAASGDLEFLRYASKCPNPATLNKLTIAGPNERRTISREDVGFYDAVFVGAVYDFGTENQIDLPVCFFRALKHCIQQHPFLCVVVGDAHTDKSFYQRVPTINLEDQVFILDPVGQDEDESRAIEGMLEDHVNRKFPSGIPPWRIVILPLPQNRYLAAFAYSHGLGDGPTGMIFHRTFLEAIRTSEDSDSSSVVTTPASPLGAPFDTPERLPISWSFLLAPLISMILPHFIIEALGIRHSASSVDAGTWTATRMFYDAPTFHSKVKFGEIGAPVFAKALEAARRHDAKFTSTALELIARAMSNALPDPSLTNFVSQVTINMRASVGIPRDEMGEMVSGCYFVNPRRDASGNLGDEEWAAASANTKTLAKSAVTLQDQAIGLLRYLPSIRKWTLGRLGQRRDSSLELSNVGAFEPLVPAGDRPFPAVTKIVFGQPGHVISTPICFNFGGVKGGALTYTISWQRGALGVEDEDKVVQVMLDTLREGFEALE